MYSKQLDVDSVVRMFHKYRTQILVIIVSSFLLSCLLATFVTRKYSAQLVVAPAMHDLKAEDENPNTDFDKFLYLLTSSDVANELIKDDVIAKKIKPGFSPSSLLMYGKLFSSNKTEAVQKYLRRNISIENIKDTDMKKVVLKHSDAEFTGYLLGELYKKSDNLIKIKKKEINEKEIAFLREHLKKNNLSENREAFAKLLKSQLQIKSVLSIDFPYSMEVVEDVNVSSNPDSPNMLLVVLMTTIMLGLLGSSLFVYIKENK